MSKGRRASPTRGMRPPPSPNATLQRRAFDPLQVAVEIVAALADAVVVTGVDRHVLTANRAAAELFGRPLEDLPGTPIDDLVVIAERQHVAEREHRDRKSTRLNSSHITISYAVFCLKKKKHPTPA